MNEHELPSLYDHQHKLVSDVRTSLAKHRASILCAGTGVGKTRCAKYMLGAYLQRPITELMSGHALFTVHRRGLVLNASQSFAEDPPLPHGVIMSQAKPSWSQRIQVASIDTLMSWFVQEGKYTTTQTYDIVVFDETHSHLNKLRAFLAAHSAQREAMGKHAPFVLGLSATPQAKGMSDVFGEIVTGPAMSWLVENKFLKEYRYIGATQGKLSELDGSGADGEFTEESVARAMDGLAGDLVRDWKKYANGQATIGFFPRRKHAKEAMEWLRSEGISCEYIDGETSDEDREAIYKRMKDGELQYIANVGVVERGTDIPIVGCVQLCTCVGTITRFRQMIGRGSRPHDLVKECIVIDHGGNVKRHGLFEDEVKWTLDWDSRPTKEHKPKPTVQCPECGEIYRGGECKNCGHAPKPKELAAQGLKFNGSKLEEIDTKKLKKSEKSSEQILTDQLYRCGKGNKTFNQAIRLAYQEAEKIGAKFVVPKTVTVAGRRFEVVPKNDADMRKMKVADLYPFTVGRWSPSDNPFMVKENT